MEKFLAPSPFIDSNHPRVARKAAELAMTATGELTLVRACFEFVRDQIQHSWDYQRNPVTCKASDVLLHGTGYCYAKSHLLAALLRANGIPAGLSYQRLSVGDAGAPYCLHGLNAVYLTEHGWYRIDARGNKPGVNAAFTPPLESLAFTLRESQEYDLPDILPEPLAQVVSALEQAVDIAALHANLPDVQA